MLDDRPYMRQPTYDSPRSTAVILVIVNVAIWFLTLFLDKEFINTYLALSLDGLSNGYLWQFFTFQFLHATPAPWHLAFNCLGLYLFGRAIEDALGRATFLRLYFAAGLAGGLLQCALMKLGVISPTSLIGASGGVVGLVAAFAALFPEQQLNLMFLPIRFRAKHLLWGVAVIDLIGLAGSITGRLNTDTAHAAHLGGLIAGYIYIRWGPQAESLFSSRRSRERRFRPRELVRIHTAKAESWQTPKEEPPREVPSAEFISREVDPILDKISAHGIQSLTAHERQVLDAARSKLGKR